MQSSNKIVWSIEEITGRDCTKQVNYLKTSVESAKEHCPSHPRVLFYSESIGDALGIQGILNSFDEAYKLDYSTYSLINPYTFWASSKFRALKALIGERVVFVDNDFFFRSNFLDEINEEKVCYNFTEEVGRLYPNSLDPNIKHLVLGRRLYGRAVNTSFMYFPDRGFLKEYVELALNLMEKLSMEKVRDTKYMIFAEQQIFANLLVWNNLEYQCLSKDIWVNSKRYWKRGEEKVGIWNKEECKTRFFHVGESYNV